MSRTITALFDSREDAEAARQRLAAANVDAGDVHIHDQSSESYRGSGSYSTHRDRGLWASVRNAFLPDEDRHHYEEGVRRGHVLLTADVDESQVDEAVRVLEQGGTVDIDSRSAEWRAGGWDYPNENVVGTSTSTGRGAAGATSGQDHLSDRAGLENTLARGTQDQSIPIVEEQLVVGKREVNRGGVRVRTYVTEVPVHEQIRLRDESIHVERRPVDRQVEGTGADLFRDRTVELTETDEEAVVGKQARVVEEVVVRKTAGERVEEIDDTVRRTEVEVDRDGGLDRDRS